MGKRQPTEEQKAKAADRRERMRAIAKQIGEMDDAARARLVGGGVYTIEGRALSIFNQCMILSQDPGATVVGGFAQWRTAGRKVCKGGHGVAIWIPIHGGEAKPGEDPTAGTKPRFLLGTVFDVSQTEPLTEPAAAEMAGAN
jgi:hypothetical protein